MQPDQNQYNFIIDPSQGNTTGPAFLQDPKKRNIVAILFVGGVLLLLLIGFAIFSSLSSRNTSATLDVAAYQSELVRISTLGLEQAKDPFVRSKVSTMQSFAQSDLNKTTGYLTSAGGKFEEKEAALRLDPAVDENLAAAALRNSYDTELLKALETTSALYKASLQQALNGTSAEDELAILQIAAKNILTYEGPQENSGVAPAVAVTKL
jgi:hypothetical protein